MVGARLARGGRLVQSKNDPFDSHSRVLKYSNERALMKFCQTCMGYNLYVKNKLQMEYQMRDGDILISDEGW